MFFRGESDRLENLPATAATSSPRTTSSLLDPPIVGLYLPQQVAFFARKTLWKPGFASWWLDNVGTIPVDRDGGTDVAAIKRGASDPETGKGRHTLPRRNPLEGWKLQPPKPGIGLLACRTGVPVVPARVFGSFDAFGRDGRLHLGVPVSVRYGRPLEPAEYDRPEDGKERYVRAAERIMAAIARIAPPRRPVL